MCFLHIYLFIYSRVPNRRVGWNNSVGGAKMCFLINMLDGINMLEGQNVKLSKHVGGVKSVE